MALKLYISVAKGLKLKVRKFRGTMFLEITDKNWWGEGLFGPHHELG